MTKTLHRPDDELKTAVIDELRWTPEVNSAHIGVSVNDGAVTLSGEVDSFPEKRLAGRVVERVHGVTAIAQEITVNSTWNGMTDNAGVVTLEGSVGSWSERRQAERAAWASPGVTGIVDHLRISY